MRKTHLHLRSGSRSSRSGIRDLGRGKTRCKNSPLHSGHIGNIQSRCQLWIFELSGSVRQCGVGKAYCIGMLFEVWWRKTILVIILGILYYWV